MTANSNSDNEHSTQTSHYTDATERFPDDAPEDLGDLVSPVYAEHEFHRLHRSAAEEPVGGATWRSDDEEVKVMNYAACGYWAVEASRREYDEGRGWWVTYSKSNGAVDGLGREEAFRLADDYLSGEAEIGRTRYALVGCGSAKRDPQLEPGKLTPKKWPAEDLYTSTFFAKKWEYAGLFDGRAILSAEHGILSPGEEIEPYDTSIEDLDESELAALAEEVRAEIEEWKHFETDLSEVAVLAGKRYIEPLRERGAFDVEPAVAFPLQEHDLAGIGEQMAWMKEQVEDQQPDLVAVTDGGNDRPVGAGTERTRALDERPHAEVVEEDGIEYVKSYGGLLIPILNWCRECWDEAAPPENDLPETCPECGSTEVIRL